MVRLIRLVLILLALTTSAGLASAGCQNGTVIIVPKSACPGVDLAARELRYYVEKATDLRLPIMTEESVPAATTRRIYLGATKAALEAGLDPARLPRDAYHLQTSGDVAYLVGGDGPGDPMAAWAHRRAHSSPSMTCSTTISECAGSGLGHRVSSFRGVPLSRSRIGTRRCCPGSDSAASGLVGSKKSDGCVGCECTMPTG